MSCSQFPLIWKAGFHSPPHLHLCRSSQSSHAMCGMLMNTDVTHGDANKEECCEDCWHYSRYASCVGDDTIASHRPNGIRAVAQGLLVNPNIHVAYHALNHAAAKMDQLEIVIAEAKAVIDRWETPLWKDNTHTAEYIKILRDALSIYENDRNNPQSKLQK